LEGKVGKARGHFLSLLRCSGVARCVQSRRNVSEEVDRISCLVFVLTHVKINLWWARAPPGRDGFAPPLARGANRVSRWSGRGRE